MYEQLNRIGEGIWFLTEIRILKKTMEIYRRSCKISEEFHIDDRDMNKFIIGTISNLDRPMNPAARAYAH